MSVPASSVLLVAFCLAAAYADVRRGVVPNLLNAAGFGAGVLLACLAGGRGAPVSSVSGSLLGLSIMLPFFLLHMVGGGDVKFLAAAGAIVGWHFLWVSFLVGAALGGVAGAVMLIARERSIERIKSRFLLLATWPFVRPFSSSRPTAEGGEGTRLPYAVPLSAGLIAVSLVGALT